MSKKCGHRHLTIQTEKDRCSWVRCAQCGKEGPAKHSIPFALLAWVVALGDQHPRPKPLAPKRRKVSRNSYLQGSSS